MERSIFLNPNSVLTGTADMLHWLSDLCVSAIVAFYIYLLMQSLPQQVPNMIMMLFSAQLIRSSLKTDWWNLLFHLKKAWLFQIQMSQSMVPPTPVQILVLLPWMVLPDIVCFHIQLMMIWKIKPVFYCQARIYHPKTSQEYLEVLSWELWDMVMEWPMLMDIFS